jgi:hypothetical protein
MIVVVWKEEKTKLCCVWVMESVLNDEDLVIFMKKILLENCVVLECSWETF